MRKKSRKHDITSGICEKIRRKGFLNRKLALLRILYLIVFSSPALASGISTDSVMQKTDTALSGTMIGIIPGSAEQEEGKPLLKRTYERNTSYGVGWANIFDTYLSPQAYDGIEVRILRESTSRMENQTSYPVPHNPWVRQSVFQGLASYTEHPSDDNANMTLMGEWRWGYLYDFRSLALPPGLELMAGGQLYGEGGLIYNIANGNNPVAMKLGAGVGLTGIASWKFTMARKPFSLRYQFFAPVLGAFFSPHYGQSYYEIFSLGNSGGIVHFSSLHNKPSLWQQLSLDFRLFKKSTLRFSYVADIRQSSVNHLKYHQWSHVFMLGMVYRFQRL